MKPALVDFGGKPLFRYEIEGGPILYFREVLTPERWEDWKRAYAAGELQHAEPGGPLVKAEV